MSLYRIDLANHRFVRDLKAAKKKYRTINNDLSAIFVQLEQDPTVGNAIPRFHRQVWKIRVGIKGHTGKSGGYRLIYHVGWESKVVTPLLFHSKPEIEKIPDSMIQKVLKAMEKPSQA